MIDPQAQQAPMPEQQPTADQQAPDQQGGGVVELIANLQAGLAMLTDALSEVKPELAQQANDVKTQFEGLIQNIQGRGGQPEPGISTPEQGASGAVPMAPAGV